MEATTSLEPIEELVGELGVLVMIGFLERDHKLRSTLLTHLRTNLGHCPVGAAGRDRRAMARYGPNR
jgi:hypothetical protein